MAIFIIGICLLSEINQLTYSVSVEFELDGQKFVGINGLTEEGESVYKFSGATSLIIDCKDQDEVDYYWSKLSEPNKMQQCGWCVDKFGLTWQIVPKAFNEMKISEDNAKVARMTEKFMKMKKLDVEVLEAAFNGTG